MKRVSLAAVLYFICDTVRFFAAVYCNETCGNKAWANNEKRFTYCALAPHIVESLYEIGAKYIIAYGTMLTEAANDIPRVGNYARFAECVRGAIGT